MDDFKEVLISIVIGLCIIIIGVLLFLLCGAVIQVVGKTMFLVGMLTFCAPMVMWLLGDLVRRVFE